MAFCYVIIKATQVSIEKLDDIILQTKGTLVYSPKKDYSIRICTHSGENKQAYKNDWVVEYSDGSFDVFSGNTYEVILYKK